MEKLSETRRALLEGVLELGAQATLGALAHRLSISKQAVGQQVRVLREAGLLRPATQRYAPVELTEQGEAALGLGIPIYGQIAAGLPAYAEQCNAERVSSLEALIGMREDDFLLRVCGESMIGIGILPGDFVVIRPCSAVDPGQVAVCLLPGEGTATLKRVFVQGELLELHSENEALPPQVYPCTDVQIQGRMIGRVGVGVPQRCVVWSGRVT